MIRVELEHLFADVQNVMVERPASQLVARLLIVRIYRFWGSEDDGKKFKRQADQLVLLIN